MLLKEMKLADRVFDKAMMAQLTVKQIKDNKLTFFRSYVHTADFSCTGGVICYVGIEEWTLDNIDTDTYEYELMTRKELK